MKRERDWQNSVCIKLQHTQPFGIPLIIHREGREIIVEKKRKVHQVRSHRAGQTPIRRDPSAPCMIDQTVEEIEANSTLGQSGICDNCRRWTEVMLRQVPSHE